MWLIYELEMFNKQNMNEQKNLASATGKYVFVLLTQLPYVNARQT